MSTVVTPVFHIALYLVAQSIVTHRYSTNERGCLMCIGPAIRTQLGTGHDGLAAVITDWIEKCDAFTSISGEHRDAGDFIPRQFFNDIGLGEWRSVCEKASYCHAWYCEGVMTLSPHSRKLDSGSCCFAPQPQLNSSVTFPCERGELNAILEKAIEKAAAIDRG